MRRSTYPAAHGSPPRPERASRRPLIATRYARYLTPLSWPISVSRIRRSRSVAHQVRPGRLLALASADKAPVSAYSASTDAAPRWDQATCSEHAIRAVILVRVDQPIQHTDGFRPLASVNEMPGARAGLEPLREHLRVRLQQLGRRKQRGFRFEE